MAKKDIEAENRELREAGFDPEQLDEQARSEALQMIDDQDKSSEHSASTRFFKTAIAALKVNVGAPPDGSLDHNYVRFTPIHQKWEGEPTKFGYLATDNKRAIEILSDDPNVVEIQGSEYDEILRRADDTTELNVRRAGF
jgi:hypothetical protein